MANYANLKSAIQQVVKTNGNNEITGALLQQSLLAMINSLGGYYQFAGVATPSTNPGTPDQNVFYLASTAGTYSNFGSIVIAENEAAILKYNGTWTKDSSGFATSEKVNQLEAKVDENERMEYPIDQGLDINSAVGGIVNAAQTIGQTVQFTTGSGMGLIRMYNHIPAGVVVTVKFVNGSGSYGFALCDNNDKVLEYTANTGLSTYTFAPQAVESKLYVSSTKTDKVIATYYEPIKDAINDNEKGLNAVIDSVFDIQPELFDLLEGESLPVKSTYNGVVLFAESGSFMDSQDVFTNEYDVLGLSDVYIYASAYSIPQVAAAAFYRSDGAFIRSYFAGSPTNTVKGRLAIPAGAAILRLSARNGITPYAKKVVKTPKAADYYTKSEIDEKVTITETETADISTGWKSQGYIDPAQSVGNTISFNVIEGYGGIFQALNIPVGSIVTVQFSSQAGAYGFALCDENDKILEICSNTGRDSYTFAKTLVPARLYGSISKFSSASRVTISSETVKEAIVRIDQEINPNANRWAGKTIWWCGTSIPAGSDATIHGAGETIAGNYPTEVGKDLGATVINKAVGGSMCRANVRTGDYAGANFANITSALTMTKAEIENFITNYATIKDVLTGNVPATLGAGDIARLRAASFEDRLLPYLNGTYDMPDLFVFDHGHNDFKYTLSGGGTDIGLQPTVANIGGELTADTYMTANNNEKLESFFGSLANIPSSKKNAFIASVNRNCFIGSVNFLVTLILHYNPHARIIFISNYEYENGDAPQYAPLIPAQDSIAKSWAFPICRVYEYLGFSNHLIPGSMAWFNTTYPAQTPATTDITVYRAYLPDDVHPHSDITGDANNIYAGIISEFIKKIY